MARKDKKAKLYHPQLINADGANFISLLQSINGVAPESRKIFDLDDNKLILEVQRDGCDWIITLQDLKKDELPKIADSANGTDEQNLDIPEGKMLSYKNIFVYRDGENLLAGVALYGCPQIGKLKFCLEQILKNEYGNEASLRISLIFEHNLIERIRNCRTITAAEFSSADYDGEQISEERFELYKEYIAGHNYEKITKVKGKKGDNIKHLLQPILDDVISHRDDDSIPVGIKMKMDGENINFEKYYKVLPISVKMDPENAKYVDYESLVEELKNTISQNINQESQR